MMQKAIIIILIGLLTSSLVLTLYSLFIDDGVDFIDLSNDTVEGGGIKIEN